MQKRFARIYPVTFLAAFLLLCFKIIEFFLFPEKSDLSITDFFLSISLQQAWIPAKAMSFNTPAWSITIEWFFYLCFPFLFNCFYKRPNLKMLTAIVLLVWVFSQYILHYLLDSSYYTGFPSASHSFIHYFPLLHLNEFLIGNVAGLVFVKYLNGRKKANELAIIALLVVAAIALTYNTTLSFHNGLLMLVFVPLILLISCNNGPFSKLSNHKFLVFLGEISFGIYILQKPIFMAINGVFTALNCYQPILQFYISLIGLLLVSALSYHYFETPLRRKISTFKLFEK
jgi:peptidoglycan/LPS O-acetylase OafA/YrhL